MKKSVIQTLNYILFFAIGAGLLYLAFRNQNFDEIFKSIKSANLWWAVPVFIAWIIGLLIRALRWKMVIEGLDHKPSLANTYNTMMFGYLVNYAVPRLGEITRCMSMKKKENIPPVTLFGTVMVERVVDLIMLAIIVAMALVMEFNTISGFFSTSVFGPLYQWANDKIFSNTKLLIIIIGGVGFLLYYLLKSNKSQKKEEGESNEEKKEDKLDNLVNEVWIGLAAISKLKNYPLFIFYSVAIWGCYFLSSYFWFKAFDGLAGVSVSTIFVVMVMGTLGRSLPIQGGGMGAYHYMVSQSLLLFGVGETLGYAYAIVNHGSSSIFSIVMGAISWLILLFTKDKSEQYI